MSRRPLLPAIVAAVGVASALTACSVVPTGPSETPTAWVPSYTPSAVPSEQAENPLGFAPQQRAAVRIRNTSCSGLVTGSGFILDRHTIVTNYHVVANAGRLEAMLSDGTDIAITSSVHAKSADLALLTTDEDLVPTVTLADHDPRSGAPISIVGYPNGESLSTSDGFVHELGVKDTLDHGEDVVSTTAKVEPGSSGSAVYSSEGDVVGILYAEDNDASESLVLPVSLLQNLLDDTTTQVDNKRKCVPDFG